MEIIFPHLFIQYINLRCLYFWNFCLVAPVYTSHADPPIWNTYRSHDWKHDFLRCNPLYQPTSISWKVCKLKCSTRRPYKWPFQNSSMFVETLGVAGFESWEMAATVTILGEPRTSETEESSSPEVTIARAVPPPFLFWWVLTCFERWSLRINLLEHSGHSNLFSPFLKEEQNKNITESTEHFLLDHLNLTLFYSISEVSLKGYNVFFSTCLISRPQAFGNPLFTAKMILNRYLLCCDYLVRSEFQVTREFSQTSIHLTE